jgi:5-methylcytosine-specific restriction protein A
MELFFHDVGITGANRDFPKTVFGDVSFETLEKYLPIHLKRNTYQFT